MSMSATPATMPRTLRLNPRDNILVAVDGLAAGQSAEGIKVSARVPRGHKLASRAITKGEPILKFGQIIGFAGEDIAPGTHIHTHNCFYGEFERDYAYCRDAREEPLLPESQRATFHGYKRANGRAGTRNYIAILTSVNCSATAARFMAEEITRSGILDDYPNIDGVIPLVHGGGCALDIEGEGYEALKRVQWGYAANPNMGGVVMVGLGCEGFQISRFMDLYGMKESDTFRTFTIQESGGTRKTVAAGVDAIKTMLGQVNDVRRETIPASELMLALQCGGSDGYSGITANVALGAAADLLVRHGGAAVLAETPEIYGAEHLLTRRAANREVADKLVRIIEWWRDYTAKNNGSMDNNPSPGNKLGGLTTILEKSLGAAAKGGTTTLTGVYHYGEPVTTKGFAFMDSPGYDPVSVTGQVASGCNIVAFTTGRGSAFGCKPSPSIKLATNSEMFRRMEEDMDIDCGDILEGVGVEEKGAAIFEMLLRVASGEKTKSERLGYGDLEFVPWQIGAVM